MRLLDGWLRAEGVELGAWSRANKPRAALLWISLIVLSVVARVSIGGVGGHVVSYVSFLMSILLLMAYFRGGRA